MGLSANRSVERVRPEKARETSDGLREKTIGKGRLDLPLMLLSAICSIFPKAKLRDPQVQHPYHELVELLGELAIK